MDETTRVSCCEDIKEFSSQEKQLITNIKIDILSNTSSKETEFYTILNELKNFFWNVTSLEICEAVSDANIFQISVSLRMLKHVTFGNSLAAPFSVFDFLATFGNLETFLINDQNLNNYDNICHYCTSFKGIIKARKVEWKTNNKDVLLILGQLSNRFPLLQILVLSVPFLNGFEYFAFSSIKFLYLSVANYTTVPVANMFHLLSVKSLVLNFSFDFHECAVIIEKCCNVEYLEINCNAHSLSVSECNAIKKCKMLEAVKFVDSSYTNLKHRKGKVALIPKIIKNLPEKCVVTLEIFTLMNDEEISNTIAKILNAVENEKSLRLLMFPKINIQLPSNVICSFLEFPDYAIKQRVNLALKAKLFSEYPLWYQLHFSTDK